MPDIPLWTLQLTGDEPILVLRGLLAVIPGMAGGDGREFFREAVKELQNGSSAITGHWMEILSVADSVQTYFDNEAASQQTLQADLDAGAAYKIAVRAAVLKSQKPTGSRKVAEKPKPAKQASLFGDGG